MLQKSNRTGTGAGQSVRAVPWEVRRAFLSAARRVDLHVREVLFHAGDGGRWLLLPARAAW